MRVACLHAAECAGCPRIDRPYEDSLVFKRARLDAAFARYREPCPAAAATIPAVPITAYRTRAKLVVGTGGRVGLFAHGRHEVVDIPQCIVLAPVVKEAVDALRSLIRNASRSWVFRPFADGGALRAIDVREVCSPDGDRGALVSLVLDAGRFGAWEEIESAAASIAELPSIRSVAISRHDGRSPQLLGREPEVVRGSHEVVDVAGESGPVVVATSGGFIQAHRGQTERLHSDLVQALEARLGGLAGRRVLDVYAGSGAIGARLGRAGADVTLVESFGPNLARAEQAFARIGLRVATRIGDAGTVLSSLLAEGERYDAVVVNPPRRGLGPEVREALAALARSIVVYVSCDPDTLARDLAHLDRLGLAAEALTPYDMIPLTDEVETLAIVRRGEPPSPIVVHAEDDLVVVDKPPYENVTPQGDGTRSLLERMASLPDVPYPTPVHRLDRGTSGLCMIARHPSQVAPWSEALGSEKAEKEYLALCRGVVRAKGVIDRPLVDDGISRQARTKYRRIAVVGGHSLVRVRLESGRTHQIRRHLASIGHPVVGDTRYGDRATNRHFLERHTLDRPFLHATRLSVPHPRTGATLAIESPLPGDLETVLARLNEG